MEKFNAFEPISTEKCTEITINIIIITESYDRSIASSKAISSESAI